MIKITNKKQCAGCTACESVCPKNAINLVDDEYGFSYPKVDDGLCVNCDLCDKVCPIINNNFLNNFSEPKSVLSWNKNDEIRKLSTSGGIFSLLADELLKENGHICGAVIDDDKKVKHVLISNNADISAIRKAKYVQSDLKGVFKQIKFLLSKGEKVLFSGTPCQVVGLKNYININYDNLLTIEVICHGVVSQKIFNRYLKSIEKHNNSKVKSVEFRNKDLGWQRYTNKIELDNGLIYQHERNVDEYMIGYLKHSLYIRPSCTECKFKGFPRVADITLGDFWGLEEIIPNHDDKGVSAVLINSEKGEKYFDLLEDKLFQHEVQLDDVVQGNPSLVESTSLGKYSEFFYKKFEKIDFIDLIHKIEWKSLWDRKDLSIIDRVYLIKSKIFKWVFYEQ
jgi:coenzyme F420-reducing hydrogenase beta subunit